MMSKFAGKIGFVVPEELRAGVYTETKVERSYGGDIIRRNVQWQQGDQALPGLSINNQFEIVCDSFAKNNMGFIRYIEWNGVKWKVTSVEYKAPRLLLSIGGEYNG